MLFSYFFNNILIMVLILLAVAFFTILERKILGYSQIRKSPNKTSILGILQPLIDGLKLFLKNFFFLYLSNFSLLVMIPMVIFTINICLWMFYLLPFNYSYSFLSLLFIIFLFSLDIFKLFFSTFFSTNKYASLSNFRMINQFISYEIIFSFILIPWIMLMASLSLSSKMFNSSHSLFLILLPLWLIFILMEANRTPFDLSEGESELVSGFNTEFSSGPFTFLFLGEYAKILFLALFSAILFTSSIATFFSILCFISLLFLFSRASLPRMRYDSIMALTWKIMLPFLNFIIFFAMIFIMCFLL